MANESGIWTHNYDSPLMRANFNLAAHAAHALGLAVAALDEFKAATLQRARRGSLRQARFGKEQGAFMVIGKADAQVRSARLFMQDVIAKAYEDARENVHIDYELRVLMHEVNAYVVDVCREVVDAVFRESGVAGVFKGSRMERIVRDMMVAGQHALVTKSSIDRPGQYWLSRDSEGGPQIDVEMSYVRGPHPQNEHFWK
jgi:alkylation response protein AidB-like acyl-CoA dehydrogenase